MGIQALRSHATGKKHLEITHKVLCFSKNQGQLKRKRIAKLNQLLKNVGQSALKQANRSSRP